MLLPIRQVRPDEQIRHQAMSHYLHNTLTEARLYVLSLDLHARGKF